MASEFDADVAAVVDNMPLLQLPREVRHEIFTPGDPLDFYGARDGKLHANGAEFHIKGINWCAAPESCLRAAAPAHPMPAARPYTFAKGPLTRCGALACTVRAQVWHRGQAADA